MSISSSLQSIYDSKQAIKASLVNKGQEPTDVLSTYSSLIDEIETGGGSSQVKFTQGDFLYYYGFRAKDFPFNDLDTSEMVSMNSMFSNFTGVSTIDISEWDMTKVTDMSSMFEKCKADYLVLGTLMPTALATTVNMFRGSKFKVLDLHNLPVDNINTMKDLFNGCSELESIDLTGWNTSNVTSMYDLFSYCRELTSVDLSSFDTSKVTNMSYLFYNCRELTSVDLSSFDTSKVTNMSYLFYNCNKLTSVDLSSFDTSNVTDISSLFGGCSKLTSIDLSSFDTSKVSNMGGLFANDELLTSVTGFSIDCDNGYLSNVAGMFDNCSSLTSLLFKSGGTMGGKSTNSNTTILDLSPCTALTEASIVAMINSCSANTSGYVRGFKLASSVYDLLTEDDIALFTEKNYTVSK